MERLETHCGELEAQINRLVTEADAAQRDAELERLRALETERQKWEAREERLVEQLREAQRKSHLGRVRFEGPRGVEASPMRDFPSREATPAQDDLSPEATPTHRHIPPGNIAPTRAGGLNHKEHIHAGCTLAARPYNAECSIPWRKPSRRNKSTPTASVHHAGDGASCVSTSNQQV